VDGLADNVVTGAGTHAGAITPLGAEGGGLVAGGECRHAWAAAFGSTEAGTLMDSGAFDVVLLADCADT
jgi:hypothetical protein